MQRKLNLRSRSGELYFKAFAVGFACLLLSLLPVIANIASTIGGYTHNARKIRLAGMLINSPLWIIYDIIVGSWAGILDEAISELSMAISIWRYGWKELGEMQE